jgi:DNA mismatch endonuclease, patch repair protein
MQANRSRDSGPERGLRSALHSRGLRFRKNLRLDLGRLRANVDIVFPGARVAVFVDGCFWHRCPEHASDPKLNGRFWAEKLARNVERDRDVDAALTDQGWKVVRVWEHQSPAAMVEAVERALAHPPERAA